MNSEDFISVSAQIVGFGQAGSRSATSRAYYGAFNLAIDVLCELSGLARERFPRDHSIPQFCLRKSGENDARDAADRLGNLQSRRVKADYRIEQDEPNSLQFGQLSVASARECERLLNSFRATCLANQRVKDELTEGIAEVLTLKGRSDLLR